MDDLEADGFALANIQLEPYQCEHIVSSLPAVVGAGRGGIRNLISHPTIVKLLHHDRFGAYLWSVIGRDLVAVKATLFDKTPDANWRAQWHQDRAIAVKEKLDVPGYRSWSTKAGILHVDAPARVLSQMLAVRIHLDACGSENGPIRAIAGSHHSGILPDAELARVVASHKAVELTAPVGALMLMRPLLVHSSSVATAPQHRRVLHIEFAPREAISPLEWRSAVAMRRAA